MNIINQIKKQLEGIVVGMGFSDVLVMVEKPNVNSHGDYVTNVAFILSKKLGKSPIDVAEKVAEEMRVKSIDGIADVEAVKPGFVNFYLSEKYLIKMLQVKEAPISPKLEGKKIMVEYAHPNTHKEMHIGHMRTLITGEAIARLVEVGGANVFRANYQGDIGPHVAKAIWGIQEIMKKDDLSLETVRNLNSSEKAHFLGQGYALGSQEYEAHKEVIDSMNSQLYARDIGVLEIYEETRKWSLEYYEEFYRRFYTKFDRLFFESEMVESGKRIVRENIGKVFVEENGAVIFPGEEYGLHTRVFITQVGNPTYEGKEMANGFAEYSAFPFDIKMHVVGSEQAGYFQVAFKALELIDPEKFKNKQHHISMGMVTLTDRKMSSRTGDVLRVDWLLDQIKERVEKLLSDERVPDEEKDEIVEQIVIGAVKYSVLKVGTGQNVAFDIEKSVSLEGNSGPYIQYTYARTQSVLRKAQIDDTEHNLPNVKLGEEDLKLLRLLVHFNEVVVGASEKYSPSMLCDYLFELSQAFNLFYQKAPILKEMRDVREFRLVLTAKVGKTIKDGLDLLGIKAPERM